MLVPLLTEPSRQLRVCEQVADLVCGAFDRVCEQPGVFMHDLRGDAADSRGHHGLLLPKDLGDCEAETLAQTLLDDDRGGRLQRVDLERAVGAPRVRGLALRRTQRPDAGARG